MFYLEPTGCIQAICDTLRDTYESLRYAGEDRKTSETSFEIDVPHVYAFLCPPDDRNKYNFPCKCPSVTVALDTVTMEQAEYTCSCRMVYCCGNASILGAEIAHEEKDGGFTFDSDSDEYTAEGATRDLYESCVSGACRLLQITRGMTFDGFQVGNLSLDLPDTRLPDFPFAQAQISFQIKVRTAETLADKGWTLI